MSLIGRSSTIKCDDDDCETTIVANHDISYECDTGYAFNKAVKESGWSDLWLDDERGYGHLCPSCSKRRKNE